MVFGSYIACLRRSPSLFFMPLVPYPARSARHLPHAGKALCRGYRFPHPPSAPSGHLLPEEGGSVHASPFPWKGLPSAARRGWLSFLQRSRFLFAFPIGEGGPRQRRSGALANGILETIFFALFHPARTLSGSLRSPPSPRGEGFVSRKAVFSFRSLPHWGRGTAQRWIGCFRISST